MPFTPFKHLARVSIAKGIAHAYGAPAVVAGQSLGGHAQNYPASKLAKASHLQNAFAGPSSSGTGAGAGSKAGYTTQSNGGDSGLAQYYAAWQHAQQTGDDADWRQHQTARRIGWKETEKLTNAPKQIRRLDSIRAVDILRPSIVRRGRANSETVVQDLREAEEASVEAEALAKIDEAIAQEIKDIHKSQLAAVEADFLYDDDLTARPAGRGVTEEIVSSNEATSSRNTSTNLTSPTDESLILSDKIVQLGLQNRFAEIPQHFESMIKDGLVPNIDAYNQILASAINLSNGYQPYPRALEVYGDLTARSVVANHNTYSILISYLTKQGLEAIAIQKDLAQQRLRHTEAYILPSVQHQYELYAGDTSLQFATKFYNIAIASVKDFSLTAVEYNALLQAYAQSGSAQNIRQILKDMKLAGVPVAIELYTTIIDACASVKDIDMAKECYRDYRHRAMERILTPLDVKVYVSLIRAYYATGADEEGVQFYEKIVQSFSYSAERAKLSAQVTDAFVVEGLVQHHVEAKDFAQALHSIELYPLTERARAQAYNKIAIAAADQGNPEIAEKAYSQVSANDIAADCAMAVAAMHLRAGRVDEGKAAWAKTQQSAQAPAPTAGFAAMYAMSLIHAGMIEEGLAHARAMFRQVRSVQLSRSKSSHMVNRELDEVVSSVGSIMSDPALVYSPGAAVLLFRIMIENGGLVPQITRDAIARLGPECVQQLSPQDIALALHVQAYVLPTQSHSVHDTAQSIRFAHLLDTVLERGILMDPSTHHAITDALPRLIGARPDLERRWYDFMHPTVGEAVASQLVSPVLPQSPVVGQSPINNTFDPYANTVDARASRIISDLLESTTGRIEGHIADSMSRLRNVRRMGRRLQYSAYAKLITAAGKAKQSNLMHEILGMAQTDVPLNTSIPAVRSGWVQIYDAMVAACLTMGDRQLAAKYHQDLLAMGAAPSANTFGIYITTLEGTFDEATEAVKIFQQAVAEGVTPSVFLFNAVIGKLGKARRIDDCLQYFGQMQNMGIRPSSVTYGTLVNALCRTSEESFAVEMFDEMEAAPNYRPRPAPYNSIIQYFLNTRRDRSKVLQYYGRMRSRNIRPTSHTYKLLIEAYATLEPVNLTAAETVLADMKANGISPEAVHYGSLIHARGCVLGDMAGARQVFDSVLADSSIRPTDNLYQNLLESMVANHEVGQTDAILADMRKRGIAMTPYIANTLIHGWASTGDIEKARSIYDSLGAQKREPSTYEAMTRAFLSVEDRVGAQGVVTEMLKKGYPSAVAEKVLALIGGTI